MRIRPNERRRGEPIATGRERLAARLAAKAAAELGSDTLIADPIEHFATPEDILELQPIIHAPRR